MGVYGLYAVMILIIVALFFIERARPDAVTRFEENVLATLCGLTKVFESVGSSGFIRVYVG